MEVGNEIDLAIECAVAASRWRIAARFEGPQTAAQFRRLADQRSAAATAILTRLGKGARKVENRAPPITNETRGGAGKSRSQSEKY